MLKNIVVVEYQDRWKADFENEKKRLKQVLQSGSAGSAEIHHIGSTSVPDLAAKPIIDILLVVEEISELDRLNSEFESLGYESKGEFGIPGRRYYRKTDSAGIRTHQIHGFGRNSTNDILRHLAFRDFLIHHPPTAARYGSLKQKLAAEFPHDIEGYMNGKDPFIKQFEKAALKWRELFQQQKTAYPQLDQHCLARPGAGKDFKIEWEAIRYLVGEKMFALLGKKRDGEMIITLKGEPLLNIELRLRYLEITPGWYMNKEHWNSIDLSGNVPAEVLNQLVDMSYKLVFESLTRKKQREIIASETIASV